MGIPSDLFSDDQLKAAGVKRPPRRKGGGSSEPRRWLAPNIGDVVLAIDPSIAHCGWAIVRAFNPPTRMDSGTWHLVERGGANRFDDLAMKAEALICKLDGIIRQADPIRAIIELPNRGHPWKMGFDDVRAQLQAIGVIQGVCLTHGMHVGMVRVHEWKGRGKKGLTDRAVRHFLNHEAKDDNESDALGLGLWLCSKTGTQ